MLTQNELKNILHYSPEYGIFTWIACKNRSDLVGKITGCPNDEGYLIITVRRRSYLAHRLAWLYMTGKFPAKDIDHKDGRPSNNKFSNLREATKSVNLQNQRRPQINNRSGFLGVYKEGKSYIAKIMYNKKIHYLGAHKTPELAHQAYLTAKRRFHKGNTL